MKPFNEVEYLRYWINAEDDEWEAWKKECFDKMYKLLDKLEEL